MALRIRKDGRLLCAAIHPQEPGDTYIDDALHYMLSVEYQLIVTEPNEKHMLRGEWWWANSVPEGIEVDEFYLAHRGDGKPPKTVEEILEAFTKQPSALVTKAEIQFIQAMRDAFTRGVGYGFMKQVIEWEWQYQIWKHVQAIGE